jgi:hypothetical protein
MPRNRDQDAKTPPVDAAYLAAELGSEMVTDGADDL